MSQPHGAFYGTSMLVCERSGIACQIVHVRGMEGGKVKGDWEGHYQCMLLFKFANTIFRYYAYLQYVSLFLF